MYGILQFAFVMDFDFLSSNQIRLKTNNLDASRCEGGGILVETEGEDEFTNASSNIQTSSPEYLFFIIFNKITCT